MTATALLNIACGGDDCKNDKEEQANNAVTAENTADLCRDNLDNDNDGKTDCADPECIDFAFCQQAEEENTLAKCQDGMDNDKDNLIDCEDPECKVFIACEGNNNTEEKTTENDIVTCYDGEDNDGDGKIVVEKKIADYKTSFSSYYDYGTNIGGIAGRIVKTSTKGIDHCQVNAYLEAPSFNSFIGGIVGYLDSRNNDVYVRNSSANIDLVLRKTATPYSVFCATTRATTAAFFPRTSPTTAHTSTGRLSSMTTATSFPSP